MGTIMLLCNCYLLAKKMVPTHVKHLHTPGVRYLVHKFLYTSGTDTQYHFRSQEGTPHNRGLFHRAFEELFHLSNETTAVTSKYIFSVSILEMYNEQVRPVLAAQCHSFPWSSSRLRRVLRILHVCSRDD